jgi:hypothetical protein
MHGLTSRVWKVGMPATVMPELFRTDVSTVIVEMWRVSCEYTQRVSPFAARRSEACSLRRKDSAP